jgi:hypothetical protein
MTCHDKLVANAAKARAARAAKIARMTTAERSALMKAAHDTTRRAIALLKQVEAEAREKENQT